MRWSVAFVTFLAIGSVVTHASTYKVITAFVLLALTVLGLIIQHRGSADGPTRRRSTTIPASPPRSSNKGRPASSPNGLRRAGF
jgi:hypothetical protein